MNVKIKVCLFVLSLATVFFPMACQKNFLEKRPFGTVDLQTLSTPDGVNSLLIGAYSLLDGAGVTGGWPGSAYPASPKMWVWDCASDDSYKGSTLGDFETAGEVERYVLEATNDNVEQIWEVMYDGVSRANDVLKALHNAKDNIDADQAQVIEGQARFLRAWYHFQLQKVFFQIPYITENDAEPEKVVNDHPVWPEIEADLQFGIEHLPASYPGEPGKATKWAATALKAYALMFEQKYSEAAPLLDNIIQQGGFTLVHNYFDNYLATTENNSESIFEIQAAVNDGTAQGFNGNPDSWTTNPYNRFLPTCCDMHKPSQDLVNAFKVDANGLPLLGVNGPKYNDTNLKNDMGVNSEDEFHPTDDPVDPRLDWTVGRRGIPYLDWGVHTGNEWIRSQVNGGPYSNKKFMFYQANQSLASHDKFARATAINFRAIRYAHVLLWRAECAVAGNDLETARKYVNEVRERASHQLVMGKVNTYAFGSGVTPLVDESQPAANYKVNDYLNFPSQDYAWAAVRMEERLEFAMEGFRFFDLVRWGIADQVLNTYIAKDAAFRTYMQGTHYVKDKNDHWPLPQKQLDVQPGILQQDPAY